jgi:NAD(P)-dependent dehydrogenase (short-subunit alcohol dehydrogenase family)
MKKIIIVTGGSGNLGQSLVKKFMSEGHQVIATVSPGKKKSAQFPPGCDAYEADLSNEESSSHFVTEVIKKYNKIDAAVLTVGGFEMGSIETTDSSQLRKMFSMNFDTAYFSARPIFIQMKKQNSEGQLFFIGSRPALEAASGKATVAYSLSKSLLVKLAEFINADGQEKVRATVIAPGVIDTPENRKSMPSADYTKWVSPDLIAENISFLLSDSGSIQRNTTIKVYGKS